MESKKIINKNKLYPIFLKLEELELLLVGAGNVGLEKLNSLLSNSPDTKITIVAPSIKEEVKQLLQNHPSCILIQRSFEESDLDNKDLIFLATDDKELQQHTNFTAVKNIDLGSYPTGIYLIMIIENNGNATVKNIITNSNFKNIL